mmetsp:Transcript_34580/g.87464  ORF Transcript_34580/g.87464 Transcript_34580/m.87464 type:complete len:224 (+) Transcript_34580:354-1025(+)
MNPQPCPLHSLCQAPAQQLPQMKSLEGGGALGLRGSFWGGAAPAPDPGTISLLAPSAGAAGAGAAVLAPAGVTSREPWPADWVAPSTGGAAGMAVTGAAAVIRYLPHAVLTFSMNLAASSCSAALAASMFCCSRSISGWSISLAAAMSRIMAFLSLAVSSFFMRSAALAVACTHLSTASLASPRYLRSRSSSASLSSSRASLKRSAPSTPSRYLKKVGVRRGL